MSADISGTFTDRLAWQAASGDGSPGYFESFNSYSEANGDPFISSLPVAFGPLTVSNVPGSTGSIPSILTWGLDDSKIDLANEGYIFMRIGTVPVVDVSVTFSYNTSIASFGFDVNPGASRLNPPLAFVTDNGQSGTFNGPATDATEFRGFVFDTPFQSITFSYNGDGDLELGADNVAAYTVVPEPGSVGLILLGASILLRLRSLRG